MSLKKLVVALFAVLALSAVVANSAMAAATETNGFWYKGATKLENGTAKGLAVTCSQVGEATLTTTVGTNETPLKLKATSTTCPSAKIYNESSKAKATGSIKFAGVTVVEPAGCKVVGGAVETEPLAGQVWMEGTKAMFKFAPATGTIFAEPEIEGCSIAGAYPTTGTVFGESVNATNVGSTEQNLKFSKTINSTAGGALTFGKKPASIEGQLKVVLTGGGEYKANES